MDELLLIRLGMAFMLGFVTHILFDAYTLFL